MAAFYTTVEEQSIAAQIADLLNASNKLRMKHSESSIMGSYADYFIELEGDRVVGCVAIQQINDYYSLLKHSSVAKSHRRRGIGKKLLIAAIQNCETPYVYARIREDNIASLKMSFSVGLKVIGKTRFHNYNLITVGKAVEQKEWRS